MNSYSITMLKTSITLFFIVSVIFSTIYTPQAILPVLQEEFRLSMTQTNLLLSGMLFVLMVATPFYAPLTQRFEKKKIMMVALFFLFLSVLISALATSYSWLLFSRVMQGLFIPGITAIMLSYVQEIYPKEHRGLGVGIYMSATAFGAVMGRLLAGWISYIYSWNEAFGFFSILLIIALVLMKWGLPSYKSENSLDSEDSSLQSRSLKPSFSSLLKAYLLNPKILSLILIPMVVFFSFMAITTFVTYHLAQAPYLLNESQLGNLFLVLLLAVVVSPLAGKYSDKIGRVKMLIVAIMMLLLGLVLTLNSELTIIIMGMALVTIGMFGVQSIAPTYLGDLDPKNRVNLAILYQTFFYFGGTMGTLLPVIAWDYGGYESVAWFCFFLVIFGTSFFMGIILKRSLK